MEPKIEKKAVLVQKAETEVKRHKSARGEQAGCSEKVTFSQDVYQLMSDECGRSTPEEERCSSILVGSDYEETCSMASGPRRFLEQPK